jgi:hypothetical protein
MRPWDAPVATAASTNGAARRRSVSPRDPGEEGEVGDPEDEDDVPQARAQDPDDRDDEEQIWE